MQEKDEREPSEQLTPDPNKKEQTGEDVEEAFDRTQRQVKPRPAEGDPQPDPHSHTRTPAPVGAAGAQNVRSPAQPIPAAVSDDDEEEEETRLNQEQQFLAILAAIVFTKANVHSVADAYQNAKNLAAAIRADAKAKAEKAAAKEPQAADEEAA